VSGDDAADLEGHATSPPHDLNNEVTSSARRADQPLASS